MKTKTLILLMAFLLGGYGVVWAFDSPSAPHTDYRTGYGSGCSGNAACHSVTKGSFLPAAIDQGAATDFTEFCLSCHNATGEAHERSVGSPSTNTYPNLTGVYSGDSHSWKGVTGTAGTRTPTLPGIAGTTHMPGGNSVTCQVCHQGMGKAKEENIDWVQATTSNNKDYTILGYASTKQYLSQYIRVYRTTGTLVRPTNSRTKKNYLVSPSEYTYDRATAKVTFAATQLGTSKVYVDIAQPYFRDGNAGNALCLDCHNDRTDGAVSHAPGAGANDNHPVVVNFGNSGGLNPTVKGSADGNIYIEGTQVLCTSCHDPHNAASKDGQLTRGATSSELCTGCHMANGYDGYSTAYIGDHNGSKHSSPTVCLDCHTTHNTTNVMLIRTKINGKTINFQNLTGADSFGNDTGTGVCEACHAATNYHKADGTGTGHNTGKDCTACHTHANGFGGGGCTGCHGMAPAPAPAGWADVTGDAHSSHMTHLDTAEFGNLTGTSACNQCHGNGTGTRGDHNTTKDTAGIDQTTWTAWGAVGGNWGATSFADGGTTGMTNTSDDSCTNVSCHSSSGSRAWGGTDCDSCHAYPGGATDWAAGTGHASRYDGVSSTHMPATGYSKTTDTYAAMTSDTTKCGKCHYSGVLGNHMNGTVTMSAKGHAACAGTDFTINVIATGTNVTCGNVDCHRKTTPNWH